ncbi:MAG: FMN-dependent NADH-azoreductase [Cellvibrio sp.]|nr:FMN-dependent NADH-azoreductase [Cellvibrio sp.]MDF3012959.1 FMN-dependent NADH-azoreductase [Cellvibrio sp.]
MKKILRIDSSPRSSRSQTRRLTQQFITQWCTKYPDTELIHRDLGHQPPTPVSEAWIAAAFAPPGQRTESMTNQLTESDALLNELIAADILVIGIPMYNFSVPASFKAWIDQVVRIGRSFLFEPEDKQQPYKPLLAEKLTFIIIATGDAGYEPGGPYFFLNQIEPYLRTVFPFIGISNLHFVYTGNDEFGGERLQQSLDAAQQKVQYLITNTIGNTIKKEV